ncbi:MAG TPA: hypothetical protein VKZ18_00125 [Polyangia bacterium]|nr:hypothetical protein [Polyangia bacterium]
MAARFPEALFEESWRSARRGIVGFNGCVWVSLLPDRLVTGVHFPFNLLSPRRLYRWVGAAVDIPLRDIVSMESGRFLLQQWLRITYRTITGATSTDPTSTGPTSTGPTAAGEVSFWLRLRRPDALREAFIAARQRV